MPSKFCMHCEVEYVGNRQYEQYPPTDLQSAKRAVGYWRFNYDLGVGTCQYAVHPGS